jgi:hypothetical protein
MEDSMTRRELIRGAVWRVLVDRVTHTLHEVARAQDAPDPQRTASREAADTRPSGAASDLDWYFASPLTSYPLLQEMPMDMLLEEAQRRGIPTENRSKCDIAADVYRNYRHSERERSR